MGDARFDAEFRKLASAMGLTMTPVGRDDPLVTGKLTGAAGYDVSKVDFTFGLKPQRIGMPGPLLFRLGLEGKAVGIYSPFDLSYCRTGMDAFAHCLEAALGQPLPLRKSEKEEAAAARERLRERDGN